MHKCVIKQGKMKNAGNILDQSDKPIYLRAVDKYSCKKKE